MKMPRLKLAVALLATISGASAHAVPRDPASPPDEGRGLVAVKAGTIHLVENGQVLEGGATILIQNGRILEVGKDVDVPLDAPVTDYGPGSVIVPGLVAAHGSGSSVRATNRTAQPSLRAIDEFDFFATHAYLLTSGVTTVYLPAATNRLIGGQGAVVKLCGDDPEHRTLREIAALQGAIDRSARNTPGFWEPPIPATIDNDLGYAKPQLPKTTMGAIVALNELLELARTGGESSEYGPFAGKELAKLMDSGVPWRISATTAPEIRALLDFARDKNIRLIVDKAAEAADVAKEIADAGAAVVYHLPFSPGSSGRDHGKSRDARWPDYGVPAAIAKAGAPVAIASGSARDLLFAACAASKNGLDPAIALRAITLTPAELLGVANRVGSLSPGKDADFVVLNAAPLSGQAGVLATWSDGEMAWQSHETTAVVLDVEELYTGDGEILRPGQILMVDGRIAEVGERVSRPRGATVIHGRAAMPGMIDTIGHLGLEGSSRVVGPEYALSTIVAPGDELDRRVAVAGITTVGLSPRGVGGSGSPIMAYKPAGQDLETQVLGDPVAVRLQWSSRNRMASGVAVRSLLAKAKAYREKWIEYEKAIASWTPPPPEEEAKEEDEDEDGEKAEENGKDEDEKDDKKKKKDDEKELEPDPVTGLWQAEVSAPPRAETAVLRMRIRLEGGKGSGAVDGNLRCAAVSDDLVDLDGYWDREGLTLNLAGLGSRGWISLTLKLEEEKLTGSLSVGSGEIEVSAERKSKDFVVAGRSERRAAEGAPSEPKGKPKPPKHDPRLEPLRRALDGETSLIVAVDREDEILACVAAFEAYGIEPILYGADDAYLVADRIAGRVAGILLSPAMIRGEPKKGTDYRTPWSDIQNAGIPVAFHSNAEEGAVDLPMMASYAVGCGMSPAGALRALTSDAAEILSISDRVGCLRRGLDADVLLIDGPPLAPGTSVLRAWVNGIEIRK